MSEEVKTTQEKKEEIKLEDYDDKFDEFFDEVKKNPNYNSELILKAYKLAYEAHKNQRRRSGEPYIMHPVAVAEILFKFGMDNECIIGALLHDVVEDTDYDIDYIKGKFELFGFIKMGIKFNKNIFKVLFYYAMGRE